MPYGLPSGAQLRIFLCNASNHNDPLTVTVSNLLQVDRNLVVNFATAFKLSGQLSIDTFLARRPEYANIGKACIAAVLCSREVANYVVAPDQPDHWYGLLWEAITRDADSIADVRDSRVWFMTFNYDRSLEYFLFEAVKNTFGTNDVDALTTVKSFGIHHLYGALGEFGPTYSETTRPYLSELTAGDIQIASRGIRIIPEARDDDRVFYQARELIAHCKRLCFLGFGFDPLNLRRLNIPAALEAADPKPFIVASVLEKTGAEINAYGAKVLGSQTTWVHYAEKNSQTIRQSGILL